MTAIRLLPAALTLSAAGFVGILMHEGYTDEAVIPVPGDVPTIGHGTTRYPDGTPVKIGDTITPTNAAAVALRDVTRFEGALKRCVTVPLAQHEYDAYSQTIYNIGERAFCDSTIVKRLNAGDYRGACDALSAWVCGPATAKTAAKPGEQCYSKRKPMRVIRGLQVRRQAERALCLGET